MKTKLLFIVLLFSIPSIYGREIVDSTIVCKAEFDYVIDTKIMTFLPATAIQFTDKSVGPAVKWIWSFSNSSDTFSTEQNPMHIFNHNLYSGPGTGNSSGMMPPLFIPTACLQIETADGCKSEICKQLNFYHDSIIPPNPGCFVSFDAYNSHSIDSIPGMVAYSFVPTAPKSVIKWQWDFGDSSSSSDSNPVHNYPFQNATYKVCLNITTLDSCTNSYCSYVTISKNDSTIIPACNASFTSHNLNSDKNYWYFQDNSTGNPTAWFWDFGDGTYAYEKDPQPHFFRRDSIPDTLGNFHIVHSNGIFRVCLTTLSGNSCKSQYCDYVNTNVPVDSILTNPCGYLIKLVSSNILGSGSCRASASASLIDSLGNQVPASYYYWSNGSSTESASNLCPNSPYYVVITSESGCQTAGSFAIMDYTQPYKLYGYWTVNGSGSVYNFNYALPNNSYTCDWVFSDSTIRQGDKVNHSFASPDSNNYVTVIIKDSMGNEVYTEKINLGQNATTGIKQHKTALLKIYPNPVHEELRISLANEYKGILTIEVYDALGRIQTMESMNAAGSSEIRLNTSQLPAGFYILSVTSNGNRMGIARFMK